MWVCQVKNCTQNLASGNLPQSQCWAHTCAWGGAFMASSCGEGFYCEDLGVFNCFPGWTQWLSHWGAISALPYPQLAASSEMLCRDTSGSSCSIFPQPLSFVALNSGCFHEQSGIQLYRVPGTNLFLAVVRLTTGPWSVPQPPNLLLTALLLSLSPTISCLCFHTLLALAYTAHTLEHASSWGLLSFPVPLLHYVGIRP